MKEEYDFSNAELAVVRSAVASCMILVYFLYHDTIRV